MKDDKVDEVIEENLVLKDVTIANCVLTGSVTIENCRMKDTVCQGPVVFTLATCETGWKK